MECKKIVVPTVQIRSAIFGITLLLITLFNSEYVSQIVILVLALYLGTYNRPYWIYVIVNTFTRDIRLLRFLIMIAFKMKSFAKSNMTIAKCFYKLVDKHPHKIAFYTEDGNWSYEDLYKYSNKIGRTAEAFGIKSGDNVGLLFGDKGGIRYIGFCLALSYLRASTALIPPQLKSITLLHSIKAAKVKYLIYNEAVADAIKEIQNDPELKEVQLIQYNFNEDSPILEHALSFNERLEKASEAPFTEEIKEGKSSDTFLYIFTSGTTGLPKAAVMPHIRFYTVALIFNMGGRISNKDIMYVPLPLHHTAGIGAGCSQALLFGVTVALRKKFSVSNFWKDCIKYKCTVAQYIGETCRFLLSYAEKSGERDPGGSHKIRVMIGNGLRPSIWKKFQNTFKIDEIVEFFGSTEGNTSLINISSKSGAVGFVPRWLEPLLPLKMIRCDPLTGEIVRDHKGFCIPCEPCEAGLIIGKLNLNDKVYTYTGYLDREATNKRIIKDVFKKGDMYFNSADMLVKDDFGYFYFKDRTGDTFRWRGENVSTTEIENVIYHTTKLEVIVYGVEIPLVEGRAGMAAILDPNNKLDIDELSKSLPKILPPFARPLFLRVIKEVPMTPTFKVIKKNLQEEAYNINKIKDKLYCIDPSTSNYIPFTEEIYYNVINGNTKL